MTREEYERLKKRLQRAAKRDSDAPAKRGPKAKINIKDMSEEERRKYDRERQKLYPEKKKSSHTTDDIPDFTVEPIDNNVVEETHVHEDADVEIILREEGATVLRIVNSPSKKRNRPRQIIRAVRGCLNGLSDNEVLDVTVAVAHTLNDTLRGIVRDMGVVVRKIPKSCKRHVFSTISTSTKHHYKDEVVKIMNEYNDVTISHALVTLVVETCELSESLIKKFSKCGIDIESASIPSLCVCHME